MLTQPASPRGRQGGSRSAADADRLRSHRAARPLVGAASPHRRRSRHVRGLHDLGRLPGRALQIWKLSVPLLLARALRIGQRPAWWPAWLVFSPALVILWAPGGFRLTCYYYRGAYYKAFWADPPSCAVSEPRARYRGEASLPLILQNVDRYFLYLALPFLLILAHDVWKAMWFEGPSRPVFGIGAGTLVLAANTVLLGGYALGCHSLRHLVGGTLDRMSGAPVRKAAYDCVSCLNRGHMVWAWTSLVGVALAALYVRLG